MHSILLNEAYSLNRENGEKFIKTVLLLSYFMKSDLQKWLYLQRQISVNPMDFYCGYMGNIEPIALIRLLQHISIDILSKKC